MKFEPLVLLGALQMGLVFALHQTEVALPPWVRLTLHMLIIVLAVVTGRAFVTPTAKLAAQAKAPTPPPLPMLLALAFVVLTGCTQAARSTAISAVEAACVGGMFIAGDGALAPVCAGAQEIADAINAVMSKRAARTGPITTEEIHVEVLRARAAKAVQ